MIKLNGQSMNIKEENIKKLKQLFPEIDTDGKIDFEKLKQILGEYVDDSEERYRFVWNGKGDALRLSQTPSTGTLRPSKEESKNWNETENLYIEGDNLEVLKLLQKSYFGKVKMIYIDPPYNTGGDFVYKDNFKDNIKNYKKITGQVDSDGSSTTTNREYSGRYHTDWLNMMYPRLRLAWNLLTNDGVIFISIDDNEMNNLKKICDEIFGENNFITSLIPILNPRGSQSSKDIAINHEYILCYKKSQACELRGFALSEEQRREYNKSDEKGKFREIGLRKRGAGARRIDSPNLYYPIYYNPDKESISIDYTEGCIKIVPKLSNGTDGRWRWSREKVEKNKAELYVRTVNRNGKEEYDVFQKDYLTDDKRRKPMSIWDYKSINNEVATELIQTLFNDIKVFEYTKSPFLLKKLIEIATDENSIILDFFAGSSTTAHAVMDLNAEDNGNRKFIMVQLPELTDKKSEAYKAGYENIAEIGKERIRRAGEKIKEELKAKYEEATDEERKELKHPDELDIGFKVFKLDSSNIKEWNPGKYEDIQTAIEDFMTPYVPGRTEDDVLYEMMLKMGLDLTYPVEEVDVDGKMIYSIGYGFLMICLDNEIDISVAEKMIEIKEENNQDQFRVIFRDEGFKTDTDKTNVKETLRSAGLAEESFITL